MTVLAPSQPGAPARERWGGLEVRRFAGFAPRGLRGLVRELGVRASCTRRDSCRWAWWRRARAGRIAALRTSSRCAAATCTACRAFPRRARSRAGPARAATPCSRRRATCASASIACSAHRRTRAWCRTASTRPTSARPRRRASRARSRAGSSCSRGGSTSRRGSTCCCAHCRACASGTPGSGSSRSATDRSPASCARSRPSSASRQWVRFAGHVDRARVAAHLQACRALCAPSIVDRRGQSEAMPSVLLEALAAGARVVATDAGGVPDLIAPGHNGWLALAGDPGRPRGGSCSMRSTRRFRPASPRPPTRTTGRASRSSTSRSTTARVRDAVSGSRSSGIPRASGPPRAARRGEPSGDR